MSAVRGEAKCLCLQLQQGERGYPGETLQFRIAEFVFTQTSQPAFAICKGRRCDGAYWKGRYRNVTYTVLPKVVG